MAEAATRTPSALEAHEFGPSDINCRRCGKRWIVIVTMRDTECRTYRPGSLAADRRLPTRDELIALRQRGLTLEEIADRHGVTRQGVHEALRRAGRAGRPYGRALDAEYVDPKRPHQSWIRLVCEPELRRALVEVAEAEGVSLSEVVRRACRRYVGSRERA